MNKNLISYLTVALATVSLFFTACEEDVSGIGNSISNSEVVINIDSLTYNLQAKTISAPALESRSAYTLLGSIRVPEYGALDCSYIAQFLPAESLNLPDTITGDKIDSVKMIFSIPRAYISGDTLAPQQLEVFSLKDWPAESSVDFKPDNYIDTLFSKKNYTLSGYTYSGSTYTKANNIELKSLVLAKDWGKKVIDGYWSDPNSYVWPQEFAKQYLPGVYIRPSFGKGSIAPVQRTAIYAYYSKMQVMMETNAEGQIEAVYKQVVDSVCLCTTAPEVNSSVNISYTPSDYLSNLINEGKSIVTTPGGYTVSFQFPAKEILKNYWADEYDLGVINNMNFSIPAKVITNSYGLGLAPAMLMVKTSELESFFENGKLPDNRTSFTSVYSSEQRAYTFNSMRQYIVELKNKGEDNITDEDIDFTLIPVTVTTEDYTDGSSGSVVTVVTSVTPYIIMPTMAELDTENARIVFIYSNQVIE